MYRFLIITGACVVAGLVGVLAISSAEPDPDVVIINGAPVHELDPGKMSWMHDIRSAFGLWEGLLTTDPKTLMPIPGVAERYDVSPDGRTYTFHLRKNARWSNGDPVTAGDFRFSWFRVLDPATASDYYTFMLLIDGAEAYYKQMLKVREWQGKRRQGGDGDADGLGPRPAEPDRGRVGIRVLDARRLGVVLARPVPYFPELVAFSTFLPVHRKSMQRFFVDRPAKAPPMYDPAWLRPENLVTNGPFVLERWEFRRRLLLRKNPYYWDRENVPSERVELRADSDINTAFLSYESGAADVITSLPDLVAPALIEQKREGRRADLHIFPVWGTYYYRFNCKRPPLDDPLVRKALAMCVDREQIVRRITRRGEVAQTSFVTPGLSVPMPPRARLDSSRTARPGWRLADRGKTLCYQPADGLAYDPAGARRLFEQAGYGPRGSKFPAITLLINRDSGHEPIAEAITKMWKDHLGIEVKLENLISSIARNRMKEHQFDVCRSGWFTDYGDPTGFLIMFRKDDGNNDGRFDVPEFDRLLEEADAEADPARRYELIHQAERILVEREAGVIPIYQYVGQLMFREDIGGIHENAKQQVMLKYVHKKKR